MNNFRMTHLLRMPDLMGLTWKRLLLLATAGAASGIALALVKSLPAS